jgi:ketosteroid isomerase-like protein
MAEHPNATRARAVNAAFKAGDMQALTDAFADDVVWHEIGSSEPVRGKAALASRAGDFEITTELHDIVANDDHVIALISATATRNGKTLEYRTAEIYHMRDGKITERWAFSDDTAAIIEFFA